MVSGSLELLRDVVPRQRFGVTGPHAVRLQRDQPADRLARLFYVPVTKGVRDTGARGPSGLRVQRVDSVGRYQQTV